MNRYPVWKYAIILIALLVAAVYALPNYFGESPAVQVSSNKTAVPVDSATLQKVEDTLKQAAIVPEGIELNAGSVRARFANVDLQGKAKDAIQRALVPSTSDPDYTVALSLISRTPAWLSHLRLAIVEPKPMVLGLDLRGGVHFMLQVDMQAAINKRIDILTADVRSTLREKDIRHGGISRVGQSIEVRFRDAAMQDAARRLLQDQFGDLQFVAAVDGVDGKLVSTLKAEAVAKLQSEALKQNITTLHNRINAFGVADPIIQQQGQDRIVVQLPGVQDTAGAKELLGRTAALEIRMVEAHTQRDARDYNPAKIEDAQKGILPPNTELKLVRHEGRAGQPASEEFLLLNKQPVFTGDDLTRAEPQPDQNGSGWTVDVSLNARGGQAMRDVTREGVKRRMAVVLIEKDKQEVLTAPTIQSELSNRFQISGMQGAKEANTLALLMRSGALAAPMEIIEELTIGPSLGAENIRKGIQSVTWGFVAIAIFMCAYYALFGVFSSVALAVNLALLVAVLSMLGATLTLPGIAAAALALGMAIDSNVLINERIREELRNGSSPQAAINVGYDRAWATILDSNITTLIAGLALLAFGSGPVRGFAVVHCLGILTSMFSAVLFSRGLVNLWYGRQKKLKSISIGTVWRPASQAGSNAVAKLP